MPRALAQNTVLGQARPDSPHLTLQTTIRGLPAPSTSEKSSRFDLPIEVHALVPVADQFNLPRNPLSLIAQFGAEVCLRDLHILC